MPLPQNILMLIICSHLETTTHVNEASDWPHSTNHNSYKSHGVNNNCQSFQQELEVSTSTIVSSRRDLQQSCRTQKHWAKSWYTQAVCACIKVTPNWFHDISLKFWPRWQAKKKKKLNHIITSNVLCLHTQTQNIYSRTSLTGSMGPGGAHNLENKLYIRDTGKYCNGCCVGAQHLAHSNSILREARRRWKYYMQTV